MIEITQGFAQSPQGLQSPEFGAAEKVAWEVPPKGCAPADERPAPNPIASRATRVSFMICLINITETPDG